MAACWRPWTGFAMHTQRMCALACCSSAWHKPLLAKRFLQLQRFKSDRRSIGKSNILN